MPSNVSQIRFYGLNNEYGFLSNFYPTNQVVNGVTYATNEHFFQASKASVPAERQAIIGATSPQKAKALGRKCALIPKWEQVKEEVMLTGLRAKFSDPELRSKLLATEDSPLIEASPRDSYWGAAANGKNRLGHLLMQVRVELKE